MTENETNVTIESREGIKLTKNSRGYNWEIKINDFDIDKLEALNLDMNKRFGVLLE